MLYAFVKAYRSHFGKKSTGDKTLDIADVHPFATKYRQKA